MNLRPPGLDRGGGLPFHLGYPSQTHRDVRVARRNSHASNLLDGMVDRGVRVAEPWNCFVA
ncbi:hypothetical protein [Micromonospora sp. CA-111912]|uniref:hypothetical protein n=1 Tax=Micromonospora sp. CA-111912 TaxID=3239955 RepID=UPI003D9098DF